MQRQPTHPSPLNNVRSCHFRLVPSKVTKLHVRNKIRLGSIDAGKRLLLISVRELEQRLLSEFVAQEAQSKTVILSAIALLSAIPSLVPKLTES